MKFRGFSLFVMALTVVVTALVAVPAKANITITPTIAIIEGRQRFTDVYIMNTTNERQTYELEWKFLKMEEETGHYMPSDKSLTDFDLSQNLVFTPRRIIIEPKGVQKVRLALRLKSAPPPPGDYRVHLSMLNNLAGDRSALPKEKLAPGEVGASIGMNIGFSIPVVYRVGDGNTSGGKIGQVTTLINPKSNKIEAVVPITRNAGSYGALGDLEISYNGNKVGQVANANIFPEVNGRIFHVPLNLTSLSGGELKIVYKDQDKNKNKIFDEKSVNIAK